jgi:hypothetical protein
MSPLFFITVVHVAKSLENSHIRNREMIPNIFQSSIDMLFNIEYECFIREFLLFCGVSESLILQRSCPLEFRSPGLEGSEGYIQNICNPNHSFSIFTMFLKQGSHVLRVNGASRSHTEKNRIPIVYPIYN